MALTPEQRKETLMRSFDLLKGNWVKNKESLDEINQKMWTVDVDMATEMWIYLIKNNPKIIETDSYGLTEGFIFNGKKGIGIGKIADIVVSNDFLRTVIFGKSQHVSYNCAGIIGNYLSTNQISIANDLLKLVVNNKASNETSFADLLLIIIGYTKSPDKSEDIYEFFLDWLRYVEDEEDRAKINVKLLDLF